MFDLQVPSPRTKASAAPPLLSLQDVSYWFPGQEFRSLPALKGVNLAVYGGDRLALIGPSGAGKSTLLGLLNGSLAPSRGQIEAFGQDFSQLSNRQRRRLQRQIGTIYQQFNLVNSLGVIHNVNAGHLGRWSLAKALWSLLWPQGVAEAQAALEQVGVAEKLFERTDRLSGGQQQRVAIARILIQNPQVVLADEPIASLDPERSREIMGLLTQLCGLGPGRALVVSLHDLEMARSWCDRIIGLRQGEIQFDCATAQLQPAQVQALYEI
ncbi:MAG: ATP-binding cassette domain-containing protein [Synechococcales cyanobacterium RM1_1_8]|nr:ATP-binding cassette domain-containing protein [Synechococcales cyanobacterium RM1_1_8]